MTYTHWGLRVLTFATCYCAVGYAPAYAASAAADNVPCVAFVHGLRPVDSVKTGTYYWQKQNSPGHGVWVSGGSWSVPDGYWRSGNNDGIMSATADLSTSVGVVMWDATQAYWAAAPTVARQLLEVCEEGSWLVTHSMGGRLLSFISGNAHPNDPYYRPEYAAVRKKYDVWFSVTGVHDGSEAAEALCGDSSFSCNSMGTVVGWFADMECNDAAMSLRKNAAPQFENGTRISTLLIGAYKGMPSSGCLAGEDDGAVNYASQFFCADHPDDNNSVGYDRFCSSLEDVNTGWFDACSDDPAHKCQPHRKQRSGYTNYDAGYETHLQAQAAGGMGKRRAVARGYWDHTNACHPVTDDSCDYSWSGTAMDEIGWLLE